MGLSSKRMIGSAVLIIGWMGILVVHPSTATMHPDPYSALPSFNTRHPTSFWGMLSTAAAAVVQQHQQKQQERFVEPLGSSGVDDDRDAPLIADLELLSGILSDLVNREDPAVHSLYESFRQLGMKRSTDTDNTAPLQQLVEAAARLSPAQAVGVTRTFSIMLNLVNAAEVHHRFRRLTDNQKQFSKQDDSATEGPLPYLEDSIRGTIDALLHSGQATPAQILDQLQKQQVEIVLTAHPTQVQRKSLLRKYRQVTELLGQLEKAEGYEKAAIRQDLERVISSIWGADEIRRSKPSPQQEAAGGNAIVESVLWEAVPTYLRKLDRQCRLSLGQSLPMDACPIRFASWIGGDRDGKYQILILCINKGHHINHQTLIKTLLSFLPREPQCHPRSDA